MYMGRGPMYMGLSTGAVLPWYVDNKSLIAMFPIKVQRLQSNILSIFNVYLAYRR